MVRKGQKDRKLMSAGVITLLFIAAFFVLRALPDAECGFLHYVEIVNENGEIELCATNHAGFLDLSRLKYPVRISLEAESELKAGNEHAVELELETEGGMPIAPYELALTHTKKMHVMLIDSSLEDYHHEHPEADGLSGLYNFSFAPNRRGEYRVFAEIVPNRSRRQAVATTSIKVEGSQSEPVFEGNHAYTVDGVHFRLLSVPDKMKTGRDYKLDLDVTAADGSPVELQEIMGAKAHMVAFDFEGRGFAHMHPLDTIAGLVATAGLTMDGDEDQLEFMFNVPNPGYYRLFAQVQIDGKEIFGRFDLEVR